jgi:RNA polymerase subunit RPABC4/transcription elongation factor Spt4
MANKHCRKCNHLVSEWKNNCPKCGIVSPTITAEHFIYLLAAIVTVFITIKISSILGF